MTYHLLIGLVAGTIQIASLVPYIRDMFVGTTRPNVVSWGLWTLIQGIALAAQLSSGASWSAIILVTMTLGTATVTILGLSGYGYKQYGKVDVASFAIAIGAIILWQVANDPVLAIAMAITADLTAAVPTVYKAARDPLSESLPSWAIVTVAAGLSILASTTRDLHDILFQSYLLAITASITALLLYGKYRLRRQRALDGSVPER